MSNSFHMEISPGILLGTYYYPATGRVQVCLIDTNTDTCRTLVETNLNKHGYVAGAVEPEQ